MQGKIETRVGIFVLIALGIFAYMGFKIGAFRFDYAKYNDYTVYFKDISGLSRKADVKIAGVKVGWVDDVKLIPGTHEEDMRAEAKLMVLKQYALYSNAYPVVRQDGLLGPKFIEIIPGDPLLQKVPEGGTLSRPSVEPVNIDQVLQRVKGIADDVGDVAQSFQEAVGTPGGREQLRSIFENLENTTQKLSSFADVVERSAVRNEDNIDALMEIGTHVRELSQTLQDSVLPSVRDSIDKISSVFDRDFGRVATSIENATKSLDEASVQARDGLRSISSVAVKIDEGQGLLGKLVNEDETYRDLKVAIQGFKNYLTKVDRLQVVFDSHFESMYRRAENYDHKDSKGYFDVRIYPNEDHFYLLQVATSEKGWINRFEERRNYQTNEGKEIDTSLLDLTDKQRLQFVERAQIAVLSRNTLKFGLQFGKIFGDVALRFGLFEGSAGTAIDFDIPFRNDNFRWVTSLEMFDTRGWNRINDKRPHVKWLNKMYLFRSIYMTFGADDFISRHNANAFFGAGVRFGDDDVKYFLSSLSGLVGSLGS